MTSDPRTPGRHIRLTSHPVEGVAHGAPPIRWGAADPADARAGGRHDDAPQPAQRHRHPLRQLRHLSRAGGRRAGARPAGIAPTSPTPRRPTRSARTRSGRPDEDRLDRSVGRRGRRGLRDDLADGLRHPPDHRGHQGAHRHARDARRDRRPAASSADGKILLDERRRASVTKAAIEPVWWLPGVAERFGVERDRPAPHAVRADRRHVSRAGHARPTSRCSCRRSAGRPLYIFGDPRDARRPDDDADRARARRVQRLRRVRLRHLHLPARTSRTASRCASEARRTAASALIVYYRKEGRALGEVTKFLVYNARKRQEGGDSRRRSTSSAPNASPACRTCASRS